MLQGRLKKTTKRKRHYQKFDENSHSYFDGVDIVQHKKTSKKKIRKGRIISRIIFTLVFSLYGFYVCPYIFENYFRPIILNRFLNRNTHVDVKKFMFPTRDYIHNSFLIDRYLLSKPNDRSKILVKAEIISELSDLKLSTLELFKKYPKLEPSIFVLEYSTGKGFEINSNKVYSSASIIKLPIVLKLMRLIDESQTTQQPINLTDKMTFSEDFRTSGSGNLQKTNAGTDYTIDYLANIMISESDNSATNMLLYKIGGMDEFNRFTRELGLKSTSMGQWLPDLEGQNTTTVKEISDLLYNIDNPNFINPKYKNIIKEYLGNTKNTHLLKEKLPLDTMVLHKTGDIGTMLGDAGIIYTQNGKKYIIAIMVKRPFNDNSAKKLIQDTSLLIYQYINYM